MKEDLKNYRAPSDRWNLGCVDKFMASNVPGRHSLGIFILHPMNITEPTRGDQTLAIFGDIGFQLGTVW